ncbi:hypothetical protein AWH62_00865 [Maricaulis sp. W15]|uniref:hypothetical protein n=1 Tax=Maricaulis sp. W15 TaxID=1772333 RepID=UPI000948AD76|nr:hypothetical protein [Maricaulis sp. W15]OLF81258.1 hypothetical protein AWH62_00865 [Maricaulis sp. W15]
MASGAPLLTWRQDAPLAAIAADRTALMERIERLPPMSHKRVELIARLKALTAEALRLETRTPAPPGREVS